MNIIAPVTLAAASLVLGTRSTSEGSCLLFFIHQGRADSAILQVEKRFKGKELEESDRMGEVPKRTWGRLDHAAKGAKSTGYRGDTSSPLLVCPVLLAQLRVAGKRWHRGVSPSEDREVP